MTTLFLVDDRELFREGFRMLLSSQADFDIVGEANAVPQAYEAIDAHGPDVTIVSSDVGGIGGTTVTREIVRRRAEAKVLMLSSRRDDDGVHQALAAGARGFALKQQPSLQVFDAVRSVALGHVYLAPAISHLVLQDHLRLRRGETTQAGPCDALSRRERDVFELLVRGNSNRRIARMLGISPKTVETHRAHVLRKLGVHSIVDLIRFAARHQLPLD
ncbi:MAG: two component transcriptional regulator, LuxR family [bacterium]|nr:two component transcriptional regulator, LuxR family [bacterium]